MRDSSYTIKPVFTRYLHRLSQELLIIFPIGLLIVLLFNLVLLKSQFENSKEDILQNLPAGRQDPQNTQAHLFLAQQLYVTNMFPQAETEAQLANDQELLQKIQDVKNQPEEIKRQILFLQKVVDQFPNYRDAYIKLAILNWKLYRPFDAKKYLDKALEIDPNNAVAKKLLEEIK